MNRLQISRRRLLVSASAIAITALVRDKLALAQDASGAQSFRDTFQMPNVLSPEEALSFMRQAQNETTAVPRDLGLFSDFVDRQQAVQQLRRIGAGGPEMFHYLQWHAFSLDLTSLDHANLPIPDGMGGTVPDPFYAEQVGPHRSSRALAIVHLAMFEAVNTIYRRAESYMGSQAAILAAVGATQAEVDPTSASVRLAIANAARTTMLALYPKKKDYIEIFYRKMFPLIGDPQPMMTLGAKIGNAAGNQILALRKYNGSGFDDGSESDGAGGKLTKGPNNSLDLEPAASVFTTTLDDGWQIDDITKVGKAIGGFWRDNHPFVLNPTDLFLPPGPPAEGSSRRATDYAEVRKLGGDPNPVMLGSRHKTPTERTDEQAFIGNYWAYDGTALLCAPPRLYNMIATSIAMSERPISEVPEMARYLALVNLSLADAGVAAWTAKYNFKFARPITYIRRHQPDVLVDGVENKNWTPMGAPVSNGTPLGANLTPPFPSYPSGHAVFGAALFETLRMVLPANPVAGEIFTFTSDEYNGVNRDALGNVRPLIPQTFNSYESAERANARSRIYLGIHWQFDADDGIDQGRKVAQYVVANALKAI